MNRAKTFFSSGEQASHACTPGARGVSFASAGITPSFFCRAKVSSRTLSQPWSNLPLYFSTHSFFGWCGACVAPGA